MYETSESSQHCPQYLTRALDMNKLILVSVSCFHDDVELTFISECDLTMGLGASQIIQSRKLVLQVSLFCDSECSEGFHGHTHCHNIPDLVHVLSAIAMSGSGEL